MTEGTEDAVQQMDVCVAQIAIDERARADLQEAMATIAELGDTSTDEGLLRMLASAIAALRDDADAWTHASVTEASLMQPEEAEERFRQAAHVARSRFEDEVIRNFGGEVVRAAAPKLPPSDAPGRVVVTLVVAAARELLDAPVVTRESVHAVLGDIQLLHPDDFVAIEVIWSPADANDRMSLEGMTERYPELVELDARK